jgi:Flp pilus assembly protein TadD
VRSTLGAALTVVAALGAATPSSASFLGMGRAKPPPAASPAVTDAQLAMIQRALDEERYVDAATMLDQAVLGGAKDPRLTLLTGDLNLERGRYDEALTTYKQVETESVTRARSLQGQGIALSALGRGNEALAMLERAVAEDPSQWRAWNALGGQFDSRRDWPQAQTAYDHALTDSDGAATVLNNRGFSLLLQSKLDEAVADFVAALQKKPDLTAARTNLRLAMAMKGQYDRAVAGGSAADQAALLNNAGYAAMLRGDYPKAEELLTGAMRARGEFYGRASANLDMARSLAAHSQKAAANDKAPSAAQ